jgi:beta-lactamase superfamily II metal-dependent hydrolase
VRFEILNVEHGFAAYAQASDGGVLLFDCGHAPTCRPSDYLPARGIRTIRRLFITNYDEDHIGDLPRLRESLAIEVLTRNTSLTSAQLRGLKTPPISPAMQSLLGMIDDYTGPVTNEQLEPKGLQVWMFHNTYPVFTDTNNLSLLTFLDVGGNSFVLPGDLEREGWLSLLRVEQVRALLGRVVVFVASHHGRESGYCKEVFDYCRPALVVISDGPVEYDTQRMASTYAQHATGQWFNGAKGGEIRKVVTTRSDGNIYWDL